MLMVKRRTRWRFTIFPKLFLALMAVIAPLYGTALLMNQLGASRLEQELSNSLKTRVEFYLNSLEVENNHMVSLLQEYMTDKDLQHLTYISSTMSLFEFTETIRRVQLKLEQLKGSSIYAKSVSLHIMTLNRTMSSERSISDTLSEEFEALRPMHRSGGTETVYIWQDRVFLGVSHPGIKPPDVLPDFMLSIELDLNAMRQALVSFNQYEHAGAALVHIHDQISLLSYDNPDILAEIQAFLRTKAEQGILEGVERSKFQGKSVVAAFHYSTLMNNYLIAFIPTDRMLGPIDTHRTLIIGFSAIALLIMTLYSYWIYKLIHKPLQNLVKAFRKVEQGHMSGAELPKQNDEFLYLFQRFNLMIENLNIMVHQVYEQKLSIQTAELKQLQSQINPHFLYNTYFILYRLAKLNDNESIARFSKYLGEYFQYITRNGVDEVPLELEFKHGMTYAEIQNIRFKNRVTVSFADLSDPYRMMLVPRLIIQPLLENAYTHGLEARRWKGLIQVGIETDPSYLFITVEDNGDKLTDGQLAALQHSLLQQGPKIEYTGLLNVNRRLQLRFGSDSGVFVCRGPLGGLKVTLKLQQQLPAHS
jgi:two-component system sensor histidine kinase YesM